MHTAFTNTTIGTTKAKDIKVKLSRNIQVDPEQKKTKYEYLDCQRNVTISNHGSRALIWDGQQCQK